MNMANKKTGKDILQDVLSGDHEADMPGLDGLTELLAQHVKRKHAPKPPRRETPPPHRKGAKKKTTHYLSEEVFANLEDARETIENLLPEEVGTYISKSGIVDTALKMLLQELADKGEKSDLFKQIMRDRKDK